MPTGIPHVPSESNRNIVKTCAAFMPQEVIAKMLDISVDTLQRHYSEDFKRGATEMGAALVGRAIQLAKQDKDIRTACAMTIFLLKTKFGFREKDREDDLKDVTPNDADAREFVGLLQQIAAVKKGDVKASGAVAENGEAKPTTAD